MPVIAQPQKPIILGLLLFALEDSLYKDTRFLSIFSPIYAPFLKNTVLGKAKYGAFSHGKSRAWQLTSSHQSMPVIVNRYLLESIFIEDITFG